jgi:hypothetical protein
MVILQYVCTLLSGRFTLRQYFVVLIFNAKHQSILHISLTQLQLHRLQVRSFIDLGSLLSESQVEIKGRDES